MVSLNKIGFCETRPIKFLIDFEEIFLYLFPSINISPELGN